MKESVDMSDIQTSKKRVLFVADHVMRDFSECFAVPCLENQSLPNHAHGAGEGCDLFVMEPSIQKKVKNLKKQMEKFECVLQEIKTFVQENLADEELKLMVMEKDHDTGFVYHSVNRRRFDLVDCEEILCKVGMILQRTWGTRSVNRPKPSLSTCNSTVRENILPKQTSEMSMQMDSFICMVIQNMYCSRHLRRNFGQLHPFFLTQRERNAILDQPSVSPQQNEESAVDDEEAMELLVEKELEKDEEEDGEKESQQLVEGNDHSIDSRQGMREKNSGLYLEGPSQPIPMTPGMVFFGSLETCKSACGGDVAKALAYHYLENLNCGVFCLTNKTGTGFGAEQIEKACEEKLGMKKLLIPTSNNQATLTFLEELGIKFFDLKNEKKTLNWLFFEHKVQNKKRRHLKK